MEDTKTQRALPLDARDALRLVSNFFEKEWATTDINDIHTKQITGGLINTLQLIWRDNVAIVEPNAVLIRHFGLNGDVEEPPGDSVTLSAAQQAVVYWEMGRRGWGPRIFGFFLGGRLEEYIDSHTVTAAECTQKAIARDVARTYARLHSLRLPLRKDAFKLVVRELGRGAQVKHREVMQALLAVADPVAREYATIFQNTDWVQELEWVSELFETHNCRISVTHGDANHLNVLVKNIESDCRIVLIDYETLSYSYRGFDIGGHFNERMYCYNQPGSQLTGYSAPNIEEQRWFCEAYLQEMRDLGEEISQHDTIDHLVLEASIGQLYQILFTNLMCIAFDEVEVDPLFLTGLVHMMKTYRQIKAEFLSCH